MKTSQRLSIILLLQVISLFRIGLCSIRDIELGNRYELTNDVEFMLRNNGKQIIIQSGQKVVAVAKKSHVESGEDIFWIQEDCKEQPKKQTYITMKNIQNIQYLKKIDKDYVYEKIEKLIKFSIEGKYGMSKSNHNDVPELNFIVEENYIGHINQNSKASDDKIRTGWKILGYRLDEQYQNLNSAKIVDELLFKSKTNKTQLWFTFGKPTDMEDALMEAESMMKKSKTVEELDSQVQAIKNKYEPRLGKKSTFHAKVDKLHQTKVNNKSIPWRNILVMVVIVLILFVGLSHYFFSADTSESNSNSSTCQNQYSANDSSLSISLANSLTLQRSNSISNIPTEVPNTDSQSVEEDAASSLFNTVTLVSKTLSTSLANTINSVSVVVSSSFFISTNSISQEIMSVPNNVISKKNDLIPSSADNMNASQESDELGMPKTQTKTNFF